MSADVLQFPREKMPIGAAMSALVLRNITASAAAPRPLVDERTGIINGDAVQRRSDEIFATKQHFIDEYEGEPRRYWAENLRARATAQAAQEACDAQAAWINARLKLEYTRREQNELERLNSIMTSAPIDARGKAIYDEAALAHRRIRDRARMRCVDALFNPTAQG